MAQLAALVNAGRFAELEAQTRALLERRPDAGLAWKALSVALAGQDKPALEALATAASLLPNDAEAHRNLGNALLRAGQLDRAVASYGSALELAPDDADVCNNLGNALRALGQLDRAIARYRQALEIRPGFAEGHSNLGNALRAAGRLDDAVVSYTTALALRPDYPEACNNLGNALLDLGQFAAAAASYRRAAALKPQFVEAHSNLGNALRSLGQSEAAAASYRRALALDAGFAAAHSNLGDVLRDLGQLNEAAASCRRAIEIQPDLAGAHNSLGNALMDGGELDEAAAAYGRALALRRDFVEAHINLGLVQRQLGAAAEAQARCRLALELNPNAAAALVLQAELHADSGRFLEAEALFARAAEINPELPEACAGIAHLRRMSVSDAPWLEQAQRLAGRQLPPRQEVHLRYALGKYFDDVNEFEQAFDHYRHANDLTKLYCGPHDREQLTLAVELMTQSYDRQWARRPRSLPLSSARPVFIVGMPRSGTTLAEQILASHPSVFGAGEQPYWSAAAARYRSLAVDAETSENAAAELGNEYLRLLAGLSPDALRVVDKMPANFMSLGLIHEALPNARVIHMQRNPIDTCLSIYFQHFKAGHSYANDLDDLAHYYTQYLRVMEHWRSTLPEGVILDLPYEGLIDDQEAWSRKMLAFIGVPWDPGCLDFHRTRRSVSTASKWQVRQALHGSSVGRWRNYEKFVGPLRHLARSAAPG